MILSLSLLPKLYRYTITMTEICIHKVFTFHAVLFKVTPDLPDLGSCTSTSGSDTSYFDSMLYMSRIKKEFQEKNWDPAPRFL